jgi:hypothetical protein
LPDNVIDEVESAAVLTIVTLPLIAPLVAGSNMTLRATVAPGATLNPPDEAPVALRPGPARMTFEMTKLALPEFEIEIVCVLLLPTVTLPKLMAAGEADSCPCNGGVPEELLPDELPPGVLVDEVPDDELLAEVVVVDELVAGKLFVEVVLPDEVLLEEPPTTPLFPLTDGLETPVPVKSTRIGEPFVRAKTSCPLKDSVALGLNVTKMVKLLPGARLRGSEGPR